MIEVEHNTDTRLVPLDGWERSFIREMVRAELTMSQHTPEEDTTRTERLRELLKKVDPVYRPPLVVHA